MRSARRSQKHRAAQPRKCGPDTRPHAQHDPARRPNIHAHTLASLPPCGRTLARIADNLLRLLLGLEQHLDPVPLGRRTAAEHLALDTGAQSSPR